MKHFEVTCPKNPDTASALNANWSGFGTVCPATLRKRCLDEPFEKVIIYFFYDKFLSRVCRDNDFTSWTLQYFDQKASMNCEIT